GTATYFRVELPESRPARLDVGTLRLGHPFDPEGKSARIEKSSLIPVAEIEVESAWLGQQHIVTVSGAAGQPYILQHFDLGEPYYCGGRSWPLKEDGAY